MSAPMVPRWLICFLIGILVVSRASAQSTERVLHHEVLPSGGEIVVSQSPLISGQIVADLLTHSPERAAELKNLYNVTVQVRSKGGENLTLSSWPVACPNEEDYLKCQVLDLAVIPAVVEKPVRLALPDRVVVAFAHHTGSVWLAEYGVLNPHNGAVLRHIGATDVPTKFLPQRLSAKLRYDEQRKCLEAEVIDQVKEFATHTLFREKAPASLDEWEFERVKVWSETVQDTTREAKH